jgi:hypothetical protein
VTDHAEKSALFFQEFKRRIGTSIEINMQFDLQDIVRAFDGLEQLTLTFSTKEIDMVILDLPHDKAPGPDGFNSVFFKKAWHTIREDVYKLCFDFYNHQVVIKNINYYYITLIPKKDNRETVCDFRSISLVNTSPKIITKLLANRLQPFALQVVHENQYGFIKGRTIQDWLGWAF